MPDPPRSFGAGPDDGSTPGAPPTPRWVKVFGIVALVVALGIVVLLVTGGPGGHGPSRHAPPGGPGGHTLWPSRPSLAHHPGWQR